MADNEGTMLTVKQKLRKGVFLLPSLITTFGFFCGFYALISVFNGEYLNAAYLIILAGFFDFLDGKVARLTNSTSHFGMEYDSLADLMSFGIAPAFLVYSWVLQPYGRVGWMAAFLYVICGALRLARFNTHSSTITAGNRFIGLPIPAAAGLIASMVILTKEFFVIEKLHPVIIVATVYALAFLMISNLKYASFKKFEFEKRKTFSFLVFTVLFIYVIAVLPELMLFLVALIYAGSGPFTWVKSKLARFDKTAPPATSEIEKTDKPEP